MPARASRAGNGGKTPFGHRHASQGQLMPATPPFAGNTNDVQQVRTLVLMALNFMMVLHLATAAVLWFGGHRAAVCARSSEDVLGAPR